MRLIKAVVDYCLILFLFNLFRSEPGDRVEIDEPIAQVETDKVFSIQLFSKLEQLSFYTELFVLQVTIDVASPEAGIIQEVKI